MSIFNFKKSVPVQEKKDFKETYNINHFKFTLPELPTIKEVRGKDWIYYGEDNLYPQNLKKIIMQSPTQGAIIKGKSGMTAGDGILINKTKTVEDSERLLSELPTAVLSMWQDFYENENGSGDLMEINTQVCADFQMFGAFALEIVWSIDFSRIAAIKYRDVAELRSGRYVNGKIEKYYWSRDWSKAHRPEHKPEAIDAFDPNNRDSYNQILYVKTGNLEYYGEPSYIQGISYVELEGKIANFHLSNISNAFAPSMAMKFYQLPGSEEERDEVVRAIEDSYSGTGNAGRAMIFFSDGKELSPEIAPVEVSDLHQQYIAINDICIQNILTANQVTSPLLFGIAVPGKLGGGSELAVSYQIFNSSVIEPDRKIVEKAYNKLLKVNGIPIEISFLPFNPLVDDVATPENSIAAALNSLSPTVAAKVLENMTSDEIRDLAGLPKTVTN